MYKNLKELFKAICDAIREKEGSTEEIAHADIPQRIKNLNNNNIFSLNYFNRIAGDNPNTSNGTTTLDYDNNIVIQSSTSSGSTLDVYTMTFEGNDGFDFRIPKGATQFIWKWKEELIEAADATKVINNPFIFQITSRGANYNSSTMLNKQSTFQEIGISYEREFVFDLYDTTSYPYLNLRFGHFNSSNSKITIHWKDIEMYFK